VEGTVRLKPCAWAVPFQIRAGARDATPATTADVTEQFRGIAENSERSSEPASDGSTDERITVLRGGKEISVP
jgi:hypothetical protein